MKVINTYQCEICKNIYMTENQAKACESEGKEEKFFTVGQIFNYDCDNYIKIANIKEYGHNNTYELDIFSKTKRNDIPDTEYAYNKNEVLEYINIKVKILNGDYKNETGRLIYFSYDSLAFINLDNFDNTLEPLNNIEIINYVIK